MVRLLSMLMKDPLGYNDSPGYRNLVREGDGTADGWYWTKEMLRGNAYLSESVSLLDVNNWHKFLRHNRS
jgi:hypothetical protein